ncbi:hypothetical protein Nepgr_027433 [Nepenthes gracilis]|uniref:Uncharacterized protein n=1 Tax=Nepenthes gracilis TaxID=150966 RepID=A0AAD3Y2Y5_NEPGR|nr:hypothetical protein Nepgr_027433 [Nepenthes gracilis]
MCWWREVSGESEVVVAAMTWWWQRDGPGDDVMAGGGGMTAGDIVEVSDAQSPGDEPIPDVPAEFTGEVSGFTDNSPEAIHAESAQVEGEAGEEQPSVDTEVEVEAAIEPSPEAPAELPDVSVQAVQSESLAEEVVGAQDFGVVEEGTVFIDVESPGAVPCAGALSSEMEAQVPVAPARDSHVPESSGEASISGNSSLPSFRTFPAGSMS